MMESDCNHTNLVGFGVPTFFVYHIQPDLIFQPNATQLMLQDIINSWRGGYSVVTVTYI